MRIISETSSTSTFRYLSKTRTTPEMSLQVIYHYVVNVLRCIAFAHIRTSFQRRFSLFEHISTFHEGCSNMNATSFITFFTYMLRQNIIRF